MTDTDTFTAPTATLVNDLPDALMTRRITATYRRAPTPARVEGLTWYPRWHAKLDRLARRLGIPTSTAVGMFAVMSPQVRVDANYAYVERVVTDPDATPCFYRNVDKARWILANGVDDPLSQEWIGHDPDHPSQKVRCFYANLMGDEHAVTVDRWAIRVVGATNPSATQPQYRRLAEAYRRAANRLGVTPAQTQAVTWAAIRDR